MQVGGCLRKTHEITCRKRGKQRNSPNVVFLQYKLTDVLVSSFRDVGTQGEFPLEEAALWISTPQ